jgi:hypothetical protein
MLKLNIFILEDSPERIEYFKKQFSNHNVIIFSKISESMEEIGYLLRKRNFDIFFLDHDLQDHLTRIGIEKNGNTLAKYLVENNLQKQAIFYIHSMNPIGANDICRTLNDAGYEVQWIPFHLLKQCGGLI